MLVVNLVDFVFSNAFLFAHIVESYFKDVGWKLFALSL